MEHGNYETYLFAIEQIRESRMSYDSILSKIDSDKTINKPLLYQLLGAYYINEGSERIGQVPLRSIPFYVKDFFKPLKGLVELFLNSRQKPAESLHNCGNQINVNNVAIEVIARQGHGIGELESRGTLILTPWYIYFAGRPLSIKVIVENRWFREGLGMLMPKKLEIVLEGKNLIMSVVEKLNEADFVPDDMVTDWLRCLPNEESFAIPVREIYKVDLKEDKGAAWVTVYTSQNVFRFLIVGEMRLFYEAFCNTVSTLCIANGLISISKESPSLECVMYDFINDEIREISEKEISIEINQLQKEIQKLRNPLSGIFRSNKTLIQSLNQYINKKQNKALDLLGEYRIAFNTNLIDELKAISTNYSLAKEILMPFIEAKILDEKHPHQILIDLPKFEKKQKIDISNNSELPADSFKTLHALMEKYRNSYGLGDHNKLIEHISENTKTRLDAENLIEGYYKKFRLDLLNELRVLTNSFGIRKDFLTPFVSHGIILKDYIFE